MKQIRSNQQGIAHLGLILLAVGVVVVIGFVGWRVTSKKTDTVADTVASTAAKAALKEQCKQLNDDNLCKFFTSWKTSKQYRMTMTDPSGSKSTFEVDGTKSHITMSGETVFDVITIDKTTYTKAGSTWYKQTIKSEDQNVASKYKEDFKEPASSKDEKTVEDKTVYKFIAKEACGSLTCFKYEISDPSAADEKQFIWFDTKDYQLRHSQTVSKDGTSDQYYEYSNVKITVPSPVKELGPNQYIMPGSSEPVTVPSASDAAAAAAAASAGGADDPGTGE